MSVDRTQIVTTPPVGVRPGTQLNGIYEIDELIAIGGMGEVYRGHNVRNRAPVAIKIILPEFAHDETVISLFERESETLHDLSHDAIVRYHLFAIDPTVGRPYLAMEFVDGRPLGDHSKEAPLDAEGARNLLTRLAEGLHAAHGAGVVHRDLSPDNIILRKNKLKHAKIIDFGIAKSTAGDKRTVLDGKFAGKYNYVSPEQLGRYKGEITPRSDIYSLALVVVAAMRGEPLDMSGSPVEVIEKRSVVPDLDGVDETVRPLLEWMLQPDPADRPGSMRDVVEWLRKPPDQDVSTPAVPATGEAVTPPPLDPVQPSVPPLAPDGASESPFGPADAATSTPEPPAPAPKRRSKLPLVLGLLLAGAAGAAWYWNEQGRPAIFPLGSGPAPVAESGEPPVPPAEVAIRQPDPPAVPVPDTQPEPAPAEPERPDPEEWIAANETSCVFASVANPGGDTPRLRILGGEQAVPFAERFKTEFPKAGDATVQSISEDQCPTVELLRTARSENAPPIDLQLTRERLQNGAQVVGAVSGVDRRNLSVVLVDTDGRVYDLKDYIKKGRVLAKIETEPLFFTHSSGDYVPQLLVAFASNGPLDAVAPDGVVPIGTYVRQVQRALDGPSTIATTVARFEIEAEKGG